MTRDEFEATLKQARQFGGYGLDPFFESLLKHDTEQAQEITRLREALQRLVDLLGDACRLDHHGHCQEHFLTAPCEVQQAKQALKDQP